MLTGSVVTTILQVSEAAPAVECYRDRLGLGYLFQYGRCMDHDEGGCNRPLNVLIAIPVAGYLGS